MKKRIIKIVLLLAVCVTFCGSMGAFHASALEGTTVGGANGSGSDTSNSGCKDYVASGHWWNDDCAGATWRTYPITTDSDIKIYGADGKTVATTINAKKCKEVGATHYYLLAWEKWRGTKPNYNYLGEQVGAVKVKWMVPPYGTMANGHATKLVVGLPNTVSWDKASEDFGYAKANGAAFEENWAETMWFCWNEEWRNGNSDSSFDAWSAVSQYANQNDANVQIPDYETSTANYQTQADTFTVSFYHRIRYNRPTVQGTYDPVSTSWRTEVTAEGGEIRRYEAGSQTQSGRINLSSSDSGPGSDWWSGQLAVTRVTVSVPETGAVTVCSEIKYDPKYISWEESNGRYKVSGTSGNEDSKACAIISHEEVEEEEVGQIRFISQSGVAGTNAGNTKLHEELSNEDGGDTVTLYLATTNNYFDVQFWHNMRYVYESRNGGTVEEIQKGKDEFRNAEYITTEWTVKRNSDERPELNDDNVENGKFSYATFYMRDPNRIPFQQVSPSTGKRKVRINDIDYGDTITVCEKITYKNAIFPLERIEVFTRIRDYIASSVYERATMYKRTPNPNYIGPEGEKYADKQEYIYTPVSALYHFVPGYWNESTQKWVDDSFASGAVIGETAYYLADDGTYSSDLYVVGYHAVSTYADDPTNRDNPPNNLGYYVARENEYKIDEWSSYWYTTYSGTGVYHWVSYTLGHSTADGGWIEGHDNYAAGYGKDAEGNYDGTTIYGPNGAQLYEQDFKSVHDHWIYQPIEGADYGDDEEVYFSEACVVVTRPEDAYYPGTTPPNDTVVNGPKSGRPESGIMYAGEATGDDVAWDTAAMSYAVRRVMEARAIVYEPRVEVDATSKTNISKGNLCKDPNDTSCKNSLYSNSTDPCTWYLKAGPLRGSCTAIYDYSLSNSWADGYSGNQNFSKDHSSELHRIKNQAISVIVPDYVGDKYCNSFGYRMAYWYGVTHSNPESSYWAQEDRGDYWAIYDAACRTIAKKPSLNIWNGSLFTGGSVSTSISTRYYNPANFQLSPVIGSTTLNQGSTNQRSHFGSWSEYLAVVGGSVSSNGGYGSGTALSYQGYPAGGNLLKGISPLTIANDSSRSLYGYSGINPGSTLRARLNTYLKPFGLTNNSVTGLQNVEDTIVIDAGATANITENITLSTRSSYSSIYQLPQIIIFADDINISSSVTQIDAWLIAKNNINTCADFVEGKADSHGIATEQGTEARVAGYRNNSSDYCSNQLTINGPVIANSITLNRTYGSDPLTDSDINILGNGTNPRTIPGEVFNLSANSYLWAYAQAGSYDSSYTEAYTRELPPRY